MPFVHVLQARAALLAHGHLVERRNDQTLAREKGVPGSGDVQEGSVLGGQPVGLLVTRETADGFLVDNLAVLPECKGQGIGRQLLERAERDATSLGYRSLYLYTNERMTENIELYARVGYLEYERRQEEGFRRVFMRKALA